MWACRWRSPSARPGSRSRARCPRPTGRGARGRTLTDRRHHERAPRGGALGRGPPGGRSGRCRLADADVIFVCVPTPITHSKDPDLGPVLAAAALIPSTSGRASSSSSSPTTFPGTTTGPFREDLERTGHVAGRGLRPRVRARAGQPGRPGKRIEGRAPARRRDHARCDRPGRRGPATDQRPRPGALVARRRGARQASRERLPQREHRTGEPARAAVRADGSRRLGGHRRGRHEAVRVHALHAGARRRCPHPGRSLLPRVAGPRVRLRRPLRGARRRHQLRDATARGRPRREALNERGRRSAAPGSA